MTNEPSFLDEIHAFRETVRTAHEIYLEGRPDAAYRLLESTANEFLRAAEEYHPGLLTDPY